jgi:hypothetical protein
MMKAEASSIVIEGMFPSKFLFKLKNGIHHLHSMHYMQIDSQSHAISAGIHAGSKFGLSRIFFHEYSATRH